MLKVVSCRGFAVVSVTYSSGSSARSVDFSSYTVPTILTITLNSGIEGRGTSATVPGLLFSNTLPAGSTVKIVNNGRLMGSGGNGGNGGTGAAAGGNGTDGGPAIRFASSAAMSDGSAIPLTIDNTSGYILGGGGGGGGGGGTTEGGGGGGTGGGGGGGDGGGSGGSGYESGEDAGWPTAGASYQNYGGAGDPFGPAGNGSNGGKWGAGGISGQGGTNGGAGGAGGNAGKALDKNGRSVSITWTGGNNSAQVQGAVS